MDGDLRAFVIMPFDSEFESIYEQLIKPSLEDAGYEVTRADDITDQQNILRDIVEGIATADLVVADLTTVNANVFYELGLCHGLRIPTVLLSQSMDEVPFDLRSYRVQIYETHFDKIHKLKQSLKDIAEKHKSGRVTFGSPIIDFYPLREETKPVAVIAAEDEQDEGTAEELEEKGVVDYAADIEEAFDEMSRIITMIGELNTDGSNKMARHTQRIKELTDNPQPGVASKKRHIFFQAASDMNQWAEQLEKEVPNFEASIETLDESFAEYIKRVEEPSTEEERKAIAGTRNTFSEFMVQANSGTESFRLLRDTTAGLKGISKDVNRASRRLARVMDSIVLNLERVEAFAIRVVALIDDRFGISNNPAGDVDA
jgi:hypothetical protein